jgi:hypothetical protein
MGAVETMKTVKETRSRGIMEGIIAVEEIVTEEAECKIATHLGNGELDKRML